MLTLKNTSMRKRFLPTLLVGLGWVVGMSSSCVMACELHIAYADVAFPPYYLGEGTTIPTTPGVAVELVNDAASKMGCKVQWQRLPNKRVMLKMQEGQIDAMLLFSFNEERTTFAAYPMKGDKPDPAFRLASLSYHVYVLSDSPITWDGKQLTSVSKPIGANVGYSVGADLRKLGFGVEEVAGTEPNLRKLKLGRISAYVMQDLPADMVIESLDLTGIVKLATPFSSKDYYLPFSKQFWNTSPATAVRLWKELAESNRVIGKTLMKKYTLIN